MQYCMRRRGTVPRAFTLIELLVVVAIITLLIAILLPSLQHAREQGKSAVCLSNMRSLGLAVQLYLNDNEDLFPSFGLSHGNPSRPDNSWVVLLAEQYGRRGGDVDENGELKSEVRDLRRCPSDRSVFFHQPRSIGGDEFWRQTSYASNFYLAAPEPIDIGKEVTFERLDRVLRPASTIFWVEMAEEGEYATADHVHPEGWLVGDTEKLAAEQLALSRHGKRANYAMVDGHAEGLLFPDTYLLDVASSDVFTGSIVWFHNKYDPDVAK